MIHKIASNGKTHLKPNDVFVMGQEKRQTPIKFSKTGDLKGNLENSKSAPSDTSTTANPKVWRHWPNFGKEKPLWVRRKHFNACLLNETKAYTTKSPTEPVPRNRKEALNSDYWPQYYQAEHEEMTNHAENGTWRMVKRSSLPKGAKILRTKWVYDDKKGPDGEIARFKARLTAMGNFQREGIDYFDTFASVMRTKTFRILLQLWNCSSSHFMEHWDIKAAFINAPLEEDIWIEQPAGHVVPGSEGMVCKLVKALYGTKQAGRAWQKFLSGILRKAGFLPTLRDDALFVAKTPSGGWCFIGTHVDDLFPTFNEEGRVLRDRVWAELMKSVTVKNEGEVHWALKTLIERDPQGGILKISQGQYCREVIQRFGFTEAKGAPTPAFDLGDMSEMTVEDRPKNPEEITRMHDAHPFYEAIGCLWWLANISRPDIYTAVSRASKYVSKPSTKLWTWISRIFRYLKQDLDCGIVYQRPKFEPGPKLVPDGEHLLHGAADSSYADAEQKKSTLGQVYWFLGALVDWNSKTSTRVLDSSTDAECCSLVAFGKENAWVRGILRELGIFKLNKPTLVLEDNTAAIVLSGQGPTKRSRHYEISFYLFKEQEMKIEYVNTHQNPADFFTKPLARTKFEHFRDMIMGGDLLQGHFMQPQQQSTNKSAIARAHSINTLTTELTSDQIGGQTRTSSSSSTNSLGENANTQGDPQWAYRSGMTPNELCLSRDVFRLGKPPAELSRKEAIQKFATSSRHIGTHQEFWNGSYAIFEGRNRCNDEIPRASGFRDWWCSEIYLGEPTILVVNDEVKAGPSEDSIKKHHPSGKERRTPSWQLGQPG